MCRRINQFSCLLLKLLYGKKWMKYSYSFWNRIVPCHSYCSLCVFKICMVARHFSKKKKKNICEPSWIFTKIGIHIFCNPIVPCHSYYSSSRNVLLLGTCEKNRSESLQDPAGFKYILKLLNNKFTPTENLLYHYYN